MGLVAEVLMVAGALWFVLAGLGVLRLGDALARVHAATKATTLGMVLVLVGAILHSPAADGTKLGLAIVLVLLTNPVGGHLLGRAVEANPGTAEVRIDTRASLEPDSGEHEGE
ncbi:MAG TPA: monovalent cation/H(+) antiporter subunit G [Acidimicrobiales bacterium]|nr:monovalent cation/H(+) antiporter subunit G [Acidimicrobiales bacterium]